MSEFGKGHGNPDSMGNSLFEPKREPYDAGFNTTTPPSTPSTDNDGAANNNTTSTGGGGDSDGVVLLAVSETKSQRKKGKRPNATVTLGPFTTSQINTKTNDDYHPIMRALIALDWSDGTLRGLLMDVMAGFTVALSQVAPSVAFSIIAHMNPLNGLYASFVQGFVMAFLGGRPGQLSGPPGSMVVLYPELVDKHGPEALYAACILTGIFMWLPGIFCIAKYVRVLPLPVMIGFVNGLGVILALNQFNSFKDESGSYVTGMRAFYSVLLCVISFGVVIFLPRVTNLVPSPFVALIVGAAIEHIFGLGTVTVKDLYVLSGAFPIPKIPDLNYSNLSGDLVTDVVVVAILSFIVGSVESLMMVHLLNNLTGSHGNFEVEILAGGVANILTGFFQGFAGCGLVGPSILNFTTGGGFRRVSALIYSVGMILVVVVASPAIDLVPMPVLAAVVFYVSYKTFDWGTFEMILFRRIPLMDSLVIVLVVVVTVEEDLAVAVACGFGLALLTFFYDMSFGSHCIGICRFKKSKEDSCCKKCCWCLYSNDNNNSDDDDEDVEMMGRRKKTHKKEDDGAVVVASPSNSTTSSSDEELFERDTEEIQRTGLGRMFVSYSNITSNPYQPLPQTLGVPHDGVLTSSSDDEDNDNDLATPASVTLSTSIAFKHDKNKEMWAATKAFVRARRAKLAALRGGEDEEGDGTTMGKNESLLTTTRLTIQSKVTGPTAKKNHDNTTNTTSTVSKTGGVKNRAYHHHAQHHRHLLHHSHPRSGLLSVEILQAQHEVPGVVVLKIHCTGLLFFGSALAFQQCCDQVLEDLTFAGYRRDVLARKRARAAKKKAAAAATGSATSPTQTGNHDDDDTNNKDNLNQEDMLGKVTDIVFDCGYGRMTLHDSSAIDTIQEIASTFARKLSAVINVPIHNDEGAEAGVVSIRVPMRSHVHNLDRQSELLVKRSRPLFMESVMHDNLRKRLERSEAANVCFVAAHNVAPIASSSTEKSDDVDVDTSSTREDTTTTTAETDDADVAAIATAPSEPPLIADLTPSADSHPGYIVIGFDVYSTTLRVVVPVYATLHQWQHDPNYKSLIHAGLDIEVEEVASLYFGDIENPAPTTASSSSRPSRVRPSSLIGGHHRLSLYDYNEEKELPWYKRIFTHKTYVRIPEVLDLATASNGGLEVPEGVIKHVRPLPLHYKIIHSTATVISGLGTALEVAEYLPEVTEKKSPKESPLTTTTEPISTTTPTAASTGAGEADSTVATTTDPVATPGDAALTTTTPVEVATTTPSGSPEVVEAYLVRNMIKVSLFKSQTEIIPQTTEAAEEGVEGATPPPAATTVDDSGFSILHKRLETHPIPKRTFMDWVKRVCNPLIDAGDIDKL